MSNVFVEDIIGSSSGELKVPTTDAELATATSRLDTQLQTVANLAYDRVLAWVETTSGAGASRTLNGVIEKFTYSGEECPDTSETTTMTGAIKTAIENYDSPNTTIGQQLVSIFAAGPYFTWDQDAAGGFLYPTVSTDDVVVGPDTAPTGKWFDDSDMVLGGNTMGGGLETLRIVGSERLEGYLIFPEFGATPASGTPGAGEGAFWVKNDTPSAPYFTDSTGTEYELARVQQQVSLPDIDHVLFVDKSSFTYTGDGTMAAPFNSINDAITAANALSPSASNRIGIIIYPGVYDEQLQTDDDYVYFIGYDRKTTIISPTSSVYALDVRHVNIGFSNLTFETPSGNTTHLMYESTITQGPVYFEYCDFLLTNGGAANYMRDRFKEYTYYKCNFVQGNTANVTYQAENYPIRTLRMFGCTFSGQLLSQTDDVDFEIHDSYFTSTVGSGSGTIRFRYLSPAEARFYGCYIENTSASGYPVYLQSGNAHFYGCRFSSAYTYDIYGSSGTRIGVYGCSMSKGMNQTGTFNRVKYCNGSDGEYDYYTTVYDAIYSMTAPDDGCVIKFIGDYTAATQVQTSSLSITTIIDGQGYTWTDTGPTSGFTIVGVAGVVWLQSINFIDATVTLQGAGTKMYIDDCYIEGVCYQRGVGATTDTTMFIHDCTVTGIAGGPSVGYPLSINSTVARTVVSKSYLKGYTGYGAVSFNLVDNDSLQIEHSTLMHGDLSTNNPFESPPASGSIDYAAHHTTFNAEPAISNPSKFSNLIDSGQRNNTIDPDGDYAAMDEAW